MKKYYLPIFLILLLILVGCTTKPPETGGTFIGGTNGVSIEFVNLAPPSQFNQNDTVTVKVLLKNKGETKVATGNAKVRIFGINADNFGLTPNYRINLGPLEGQGEFTKEGGEQEINLGSIKYKLQIINSETFTLRSRLCYPYQTKAITDVCVKSALSQESGEQVCTLDGEKIVAGDVSGAPVQINSIKEQTRSSDQVRFDIEIENKGKGDVFNIDGSCEDLDDDVKRLEAKNKIRVKIISPIDVKCSFRSGEPSGEGFITLDDKTKKETLSCWKNVEETIVDKLSITLSYLYRDQASKDIEIFQNRR